MTMTLEDEIREMLQSHPVNTNIIYKDYTVSGLKILNVPFDSHPYYEDVLNFNTAHYLEKIIAHMVNNNLTTFEYTENI
ncbi:hypothetical protein OCI51_25290 (plasmid) [Lysinibacillus capsici]|uniref:hypothetical protein n=1 Tax=Lysinibacillus capsici TaxID=2115968 RepID=UPI0021DB607F|nr:hypothetical protein [Lysinibacillus capsici]UYB49991.1 hypothetical protein OCI51_25290 [Lysinibacillus capsici]